jgi:anti-sigma regulatory factor (Ser/Thr protein kinase)
MGIDTPKILLYILNMASLTLTHADLNDLEEIRNFVEHEVLALGLNPSEVYDMLLVITEAVTNTIVHGYQKQAGPIEIEVQADGDALNLTLRDDAPAFNPLQIPAPDIGEPLEKRRLGGMGIHLIREFTDEIVYNATPQGGNEISFIKRSVIRKGESDANHS